MCDKNGIPVVGRLKRNEFWRGSEYMWLDEAGRHIVLDRRGGTMSSFVDKQRADEVLERMKKGGL